MSFDLEKLKARKAEKLKMEIATEKMEASLYFEDAPLGCLEISYRENADYFAEAGFDVSPLSSGKYVVSIP